MTCSTHPERQAHAHGLCRSCFDKQRRSGARTIAQVSSVLKDRAPERPGTTVRGDQATITSEPAVDLGDLETLIRSRGLEPADWEVLSATLNEWDAPAPEGETRKMRQLKIQLRRRTPLDWLFPAVDVLAHMAPSIRPTSGEPQTIILLPDPHVPYQDPELEKRMLALVDETRHEHVVCLGDVCDFPSISRHRDNPAWFSTAQENINEAYAWWTRLRAASAAPMSWIEGNHDARIRNELLTRAERMYGIKPASVPGVPTGADALSLQHLCHLDALHVDWVGPPREGDGYMHASLDIGPELHARHGFLIGANSPEKTMDAIGMSVVYGHTHRQDIHHRTIYRGSKPIGRRVAVECGTLAGIEGGLGYSVNPKAQQGLAVATVWPDGTHDVELAPYDGKALRFRGRRF